MIVIYQLFKVDQSMATRDRKLITTFLQKIETDYFASLHEQTSHC